MLNWDQMPALLPMRCSRAWVEIDLAAIRHNVRQFKAGLAPQTALMAVVKADAYGHGATRVAQTALAAGASWLGVATVPEGIELRQAGIEAPILIMGAVYHPAEIRAVAAWQLQPTIVSPKQALIFAETLSAESESAVLPVHLKLDTGMSRLGYDWRQAVEFASFVAQLPALRVVSLYSHLATADSPDLTCLRAQQRRFEQAIASLRQAQLLPPKLHFANTAATLADPQLHYDMVRVGLGLYGLSPAPHLSGILNLRPALAVKARITHLKALAAGAGVSYGHTFIAPTDMRIAVVGIGYADGVPRRLSNQLRALIQQRSVAQIGAITMDQLMLDVSDLPALQVGDVVTLLGHSGAQQVTADDWAAQLGTISWEILCGFKHRLPRILVDGHSVREGDSPAADSAIAASHPSSAIASDS
ncbi:MAG: alanine racemase [Leptolyngbya sp. SIO4C1]|nr:alanine racemase [Leptolyngbya sp. SIO4C1]